MGGRDSSVRAYALIDAEDYELVVGHRWWLSTAGYAFAKGADGRSVLMHRLLMGCARGDQREVDHHNRNRLDNRRSNLRFCTHAENMANLNRPCCVECGGEIPERPAKPSDSRGAARDRKRRQRERDKAALAIACPTCGADPGNPCRNSGRYKATLHTARRDAANG